ncbi:MAG: FIST N-terminal domain-containing protein [bacterium]
MATKFGTGFASGEDSFKVGQEAAKKAMVKINDEKVDLSLVFASSKYNYEAVVKAVREVTGKAPLIGCSSAGEFSEENVGEGSVVCAVIKSDTHKFYTGAGKGLKGDEVGAMREACKKFPAVSEQYPYLSGILLIDGLAGKGEEASLAALEVLGPNVKFSGGAAADDLKFKETRVFTDDEVATDAVSLAYVTSRVPMAIGVKHGHSPVSPALTITKAKDNVLYEINGKPAFDVWKDHLRDFVKEEGIDVDKLKDASEIGTFLLRYELGLLTGEDYKVRVPLSINDDRSINFACTIVEGSVIRIMSSPKESQIASAKKAAEIALNAARGRKIAGAIVFDCVCRGIILGADFQKGVEAIKGVLGNVPLIGFETYGEIAMEIGQLSGFHNTTSVVLLIPA